MRPRSADMATLSPELNSPVMGKNSKTAASVFNFIVPDLIRRRSSKLALLHKAFKAESLSGETDPAPPSPPPPYAEPPVPGSAHGIDGSATDISRQRGSGFRGLSQSSAHGVQWKFAGEGCRLVEHARQEAASVDGDADLTRKMYIDGTGYLLKALPDLTAEESAQLAKYLPDSFRTGEPQPASQDLRAAATEAEKDQNNYVYRFVTAATLYGILLGSLLMPVLERCAATAYRYDQRYRISERAVNFSAQAFSSLARGVFASLNDGKSGQLALGSMLYAVEGASRGVLDGYGEAMKRRAAGESQYPESDSDRQ